MSEEPENPEEPEELSAALSREVAELVEQRHALLTEIAALRRTRQDLAEAIATAESRHARVAEQTLEARERRQSLAGEVMALCGERATLIERVSALRIAAIELESGQLTTIPLPPLAMITPAGPEPIATPLLKPEPPRDSPVPDEDNNEWTVLSTVSGRAGARWLARACSVVKPRNDHYEIGQNIVVRQNEDRFRLSSTATAIVAAVADGAGSSGLFCGPWAQELVGRLPAAPIEDIDALNQWLDCFCLDFRKTMAARCKADPPKHSKFVREGSCATLTACWLTVEDQGLTLRWLGYGDSPLLVLDRRKKEPEIMISHPPDLAAFERDPYLLNWQAMPDARRLNTGKLDLPARASVILATDGIGKYLMRSLLVDRSGATIAETRNHLDSDTSFSALVAARCEDGVLANDDSTVIMIEIEQDVP
ncbi:MAG: hypothetical protein WCF85_00580 [Rhodospirillaceae bacterium]